MAKFEIFPGLGDGMLPSLTGFGWNETMRRCRARAIAEAEGRDPFEVLAELRAQHLAELKRELAATAPTDPDFERRVDAVEGYAQYVEIQGSRSRGRA